MYIIWYLSLVYFQAYHKTRVTLCFCNHFHIIISKRKVKNFLEKDKSKDEQIEMPLNDGSQLSVSKEQGYIHYK